MAFKLTLLRNTVCFIKNRTLKLLVITSRISKKRWYKQSTHMTKVTVNVQNVVLWPWRKLWVVSYTVNGLVHNHLFQVSPDLNKSLLQFSQITNRFLIHVLQHAAPDFTINGIQVRTTRRPQVRRNEIWRCSNSIFMPTCLRGPVFYETQCIVILCTVHFRPQTRMDNF